MDDIDALLYMPSSFVCPKCNFRLEKKLINPETGEIGIRVGGEEAEPCPNDGQMMNRVTWKDAYSECGEFALERVQALHALDELLSACADGIRRYRAGDSNAIMSNLISATMTQAENVLRKAGR